MSKFSGGQIFKLKQQNISFCMLQSKESAMSTFQSRVNTYPETTVSRFRQEFKYDINDYLPTDIPIKNSLHFYSFSKNEQQLNNHYARTRTKTVGNNDENQNSLDSLTTEKLEKLSIQYEKMAVQWRRKQKDYQQKIYYLESTIEKMSKNEKKLEQENKKYQQKVIEINEMMKRVQNQKKDAEALLIQMNRKMELKQKNIRIFCQKYEICLQPKTKHSYSIEVQTQKQQPKQTIEIEQIPKLLIPSTIAEPRSNRKTSCLGKPQFYQLYQQQNDQQFELNNQMTSRSQVILSGLKPKKPVFMENVSEFTDKQNDRNRGNKRIQDRIAGNFSQVSKNKMKIKNQEVEIYPIQDSQIEDIVNAILTQ